MDKCKGILHLKAREDKGGALVSVREEKILHRCASRLWNVNKAEGRLALILGDASGPRRRGGGMRRGGMPW